MSSLFDIGKSGLNSYRQALAVTGQNIANINTDGYKRRGANLEEVSANQSGINSTGNSPGLGVRVSDVRRAFDEFLLTRARSTTSYAEASTTFSTSIGQLEDIILPGEANLGAAIGRFFTGLQEVSSMPSDLAARTVALEQTKQMAESFNQTSQLISGYRDGLMTQAKQQLGDVNVLTEELASINFQLSTTGGSSPNNALLDSRDAVIDKLSEYVELSVDLNDKGAATVTLGNNVNGPRLVEADRATRLGADMVNDKMTFVLGPGAENILTSQVTNGSLAGIAAATATAGDVMAEIDNMAFVLVQEFNAIHSRGLNLEGDRSGNLFRALDVKVIPNPTNTGAASTELTVTDYNLLQPGRVTFTYDASKDVWNGRDDYGELVTSGREMVTLPGTQINFLGKAADFDQFIYDPVSGTASGVSVAIRRPQDFAAASPLLVSADPRNAGRALLDASLTDPASPPDLPQISEVFSNNRSAVAATKFLSGGAVAVIPANTSNLDIFSLSGQSTASFALSPESLADIDDITLTVRSLDENDETIDRKIDFNVAFADIKGFDGSWLDFDQIADLMNVGTITGVVQGSGETVSLASLGGFVSGANGNLTFSLTKNDFREAIASISGGRIVDGAVTAAVAAESDVQIFTREGRHIAGTVASDSDREALQAMMTEANGFHDGAVYVGDYLNLSGDDGYLGIQTKAVYNSEVLVTSEQSGNETRVTFSALEGIDTNETSIDGLEASAATVGYSMSVGDVSASINSADIDGAGADDVAAAMLRELRNTAPIASLVGLADATPLANDSVRLRFEDEIYTVTMTEGEPIISGGEADRLNAFFDSDMRLNIVSTAGTISRSSIDVLSDAGDEANVSAARRYGLMYQEQHIPTRFSGEFTRIPGAANPTLDTVVALTFDRDDSYNLDFVFGGKPDLGAGSNADMAISISNVGVSGGDASAIAAAINAAVAENVSTGDGGADLTSLVSATAIGHMVKLTVSNGLATEIRSSNGTVSTGEGAVSIQSFIEAPLTSQATAALQLEEGKHFAFTVNGTRIELNTSEAGIRAATGGTLAGAIADAVTAINQAIDSNSGSGKGSVTTSLSVTGTSVNFNMSDATGNPIVISDLEMITHGAIGAGSVSFVADNSVAGSVAVQDGEYFTSNGTVGGTPLSVAPNKTAELHFTNTDQYYRFAFDANGDGAMATNETFVIDGVTKDFATELAAVASQIEAIANPDDLRVSVDGSILEILNIRDDGGSFGFGVSQALESPALTDVTTGAAYFRPEHGSDGTLDDETGSIQLTAGVTGISTGGRVDSAPDSTSALQFEENKIYRFAVNGRAIDIDTTPAGLRAATNGTLAGAISDAVTAIQTAIDATSGLGTSTVSSTSSVTGTSIRLDLTDGTGNPIVVSDFENVSRSAIAAGMLTITPDITTSNALQRSHGEYLTTDGQSGNAPLSIADGATGSISFMPQSQRFSFTLDADGDGAIDALETYVIDGIKADFAVQLADVASQINGVSGLAAQVVGTGLQITNNRGDGTSLAFGTATAVASDALEAVTAGDAYFKSTLPAGASLDLDTGAIRLDNGGAGISSNGMLADAIDISTLADAYEVPAFDLRREGDQIVVVPDTGADSPVVATNAISLAKQRYTLSNLPGEDLIMIVGDAGARRLSVQYDMLPEVALQPQRDIEIRVTDIDAGEITYFDVETGTSLATRQLGEEQKATALDFDVAFTGRLAANDEFLISGNRDGIGDNRNINSLLALQSEDLMGAGSGGFQKVFSATVAKLGALVQSGKIAADSAIALRDASLEAESKFTGVNLDTEAANLIEQQQAYQASARVLATARELFETLIQTV